MTDFTAGKNRNPKKGDEISYHWLGETVTVVMYGNGRYDCEFWQEGLKKLALEVRGQYEYFRGESEWPTRIEVLQFVVDLMFPNSQMGYESPVALELLIGPPLPPPDYEESMVGSAIMMTADGYVYEDGVLIGKYNPENGSITSASEPPALK